MLRPHFTLWVFLFLHFLSRTTGYDISSDFPTALDNTMASNSSTFDPTTPKPPNWPGAHPLDVDNYPVAPPDLKLEQVHIYVRHGKCELWPCSGVADKQGLGERTPVGVRMASPPASIPEHWSLCTTARRFRASVANTLSGPHDDEQLPLRKVVERPDGTVVEGEW